MEGNRVVKHFLNLEDVDRRVLGAVRFVNDVDGTIVRTPLVLSAAPVAGDAELEPHDATPLRVMRNRFGVYVIQSGRGLATYANTFLPAPVEPPVEERFARLRATDPHGGYLPSEFLLRLPRTLDRDDPVPGQVAVPHEVRLLPSPSAVTADGWAILRVMVWREREGSLVPVHGALVRVMRDPSVPAGGAAARQGRGLTEWRARGDGSRPDAAEALVAVTGIPVATWSTSPTGPVLSAVQTARLEITYDPAFDASAPSAQPDLERLEAGTDPALVRRSLMQPVELRARERRTLSVRFDAAQNLSRLNADD